MKGLAACYYDGRTPLRQSAELFAVGEEIVARGQFGERRSGRAEVDISEAMGRSPRFVRFADGALFEVADLDAFALWLKAAGFKESPVVNLQRRWSWALASFATCILLLAAFYIWGLPAVSKVLAPRIPDSVVQALSRHTLAFLDEHLLYPSVLSEARRAALGEHLQTLLPSGSGLPSYRLHFRSSPMGPNAFALPGGDVVVFDQLVRLAESDDEVAGVVAHELGHIAHWHGLRQLIQSSVVSFAVGLYLGDVSSTATSLGTLALESRYSREFEFEADAFGAQAMRAAGRGSEPLASMLERLEKAHDSGGKAGPGWGSLSSHPDTAERVRRLRAAQ